MKKFFALLALIVFVSGTACAGEIVFPDAIGSGLKVVSDKMASADEMTIRMTCSIDKMTSWDVETPKGTFTVLHAPDFYFGGAYGAPQLPVLTKLVQ
ncbi:MAG TPA: hypothetical protein PLY73_08535, partial [Candidatus Ozemobacteraceae bacterium]|nr:hypothetical protein [Candidatus Ozemobacteraceae bacterium]